MPQHSTVDRGCLFGARMSTFECVCVWDKTCSSQGARPTKLPLLQRVSLWPVMSGEISMTTRLMWDLREVRYGACLPQHKHVHTHQSRPAGRAECFIHEELLGERGPSPLPNKGGFMEGPAACITPLWHHTTCPTCAQNTSHLHARAQQTDVKEH